MVLIDNVFLFFLTKQWGEKKKKKNLDGFELLVEQYKSASPERGVKEKQTPF